MTYAQIKANNVKLLLVDEAQAGAMCGKVTVFHQICERFGIKPRAHKRSVVLWSAKEIEAAIDKMDAEGIQLKA